jgi:hypothetical protein
MKKITKHITIPLVLPAVFFVVASLPVELLGCRNRGLIVAAFALTGGILAIVAAVKALINRVRGDTDSVWGIASALILAIPAIFIVLIAF